MKIGEIKDWHRPANDSCPHNADIANDCNCKLEIPSNGGKKRQRARVIFRVNDQTAEGKIKQQLVVEIHDDGKLILREHKRRVRYETTVAKVYSRLLWNHAMQQASTKMRARREAKKSRKVARRIAARVRRNAR